MNQRWASFLCALAWAVGSMLTTGCATTDDRRDSDLPWNQPQPWEGSPFIPGMDRY